MTLMQNIVVTFALLLVSMLSALVVRVLAVAFGWDLEAVQGAFSVAFMLSTLALVFYFFSHK